MKNKIKITVVECYPNRAKYIVKLLKKTKYSKDLQIRKFSAPKNKFPDDSFDGIILSGGLITVSEKKKYPYLTKLIKLIKEYAKEDIPILGICLGQHLIADAFGGKVEEMDELEVGFQKITIKKRNALLKGVPKEFYAFNYHEQHISQLPKDFENFASSDKCKPHLIKHKTKPIFGIEFHPEYDKHTAVEILKYLKDEIEEEGFNVGGLIKDTDKYSERVSKKIYENFINVILENK